MDNDERLIEIDKEFDNLHKCFSGMDLPDHRKMIKTLDNLKWIDRNMVVRNSKHPKYTEAKAIIHRLLEDLKFT